MKLKGTVNDRSLQINMESSILNKLQEKLGLDRVSEHKDITFYFTMRTVAKAEYFFAAETREELINAVKAAYELNIPLFMLGGGSNIAILHDEIKGLVVRNLYQHKEVLSDTAEYVDMKISSGYPVSRLAMETAKEGYEGLEYHFGLPGTVGGGVAVNSKWVAPMTYEGIFPKYIGDPLISAVLLTENGDIKEVDKDYFKFAYDYSILKDTHEIFLEGVFRFTKGNAVELEKHAKDAVAYRHKTQLVGVPTCGCMFQNISEQEKEQHSLPTQSAGYLIDKSGLKNTRIGDFIVSEKHANFIVNLGAGKPEDLVKLLDLIRSKVKETFGIELKEEVILV